MFGCLFVMKMDKIIDGAFSLQYLTKPSIGLVELLLQQNIICNMYIIT